MSPLGRRVQRHSRYLLAAVLFGGTGCSGSGGTSTMGTNNGGNNNGSISLSLSPTSTTIPQGGVFQVSGTLTRNGGFTGDVDIAVTGAPSGVSAQVLAAPTNGSTTAQVSVSASQITAPGTYPLTITASGTGVSSVSVTFTLTVSVATGGTGAITATIGGAAWSSTAFEHASYAGQTLSLTGSNGVDFINFQVGPVSGPGTTSLAYLSPTGSTATISNTSGGSWNTYLVGGTGTFTITSLTANHVTGTFTFSMVPAGGSASGSRVTTNGAFSINF